MECVFVTGSGKIINLGRKKGHFQLYAQNDCEVEFTPVDPQDKVVVKRFKSGYRVDYEIVSNEIDYEIRAKT